MITLGELKKKYPGYNIVLTGWPLEEHAWGYGLSHCEPTNGDWDTVEIEEYEVDDHESDYYTVVDLATWKLKKGTYKGRIGAKVKRRENK